MLARKMPTDAPAVVTRPVVRHRRTHMTYLDHVRAVAAAALVLGCTQAAAQPATGSFQRTYDVDEPVILTVTTGSGSIHVQSGPPGEVRVTGEIRVGRGSWRSTL